MRDKRLLRMLHRHIDILRYVFIIRSWLENWTNRNNQKIKISQIQIHIQFTRHVNTNQYYMKNKNIIFIGY